MERIYTMLLLALVNLVPLISPQAPLELQKLSGRGITVVEVQLPVAQELRLVMSALEVRGGISQPIYIAWTGNLRSWWTMENGGNNGLKFKRL